MIGVAANLNMLKLKKQIDISPKNKATLEKNGVYIDSLDFSKIDRIPTLSL